MLCSSSSKLESSTSKNYKCGGQTKFDQRTKLLKYSGDAGSNTKYLSLIITP